MGWTDPSGRNMMVKAVPMVSPHNPDAAGSVLAVTLVDTTGAPVALGGGGGGVSSSPVQSQYQTVTYMANMAINQCVRLDGGKAYPVTSLDTDAPWVDGVTMTAGINGSMGIVASLAQANFTIPVMLPDARLLFLGQDGTLTMAPPRRDFGDLWSVVVAKRTGPNQYLLDPQIPVALI